MALPVRAQNAAVLMSKSGNSVHIEALELSPPNKPVIETPGRLRRAFPGPAFSMELLEFHKVEFQITVAQTLAKMSHQQAPNTQVQVKKAGQLIDEPRDTIHPKVVTELFMNFLRPMAKDLKVMRLWKNTREEVMWNGSLRPWRRSQLWLLLRVSMQLVLSRHAAGARRKDNLYKSFMVFLMSYVRENCRLADFPCEQMHSMLVQRSAAACSNSKPAPPLWAWTIFKMSWNRRPTS